MLLNLLVNENNFYKHITKHVSKKKGNCKIAHVQTLANISIRPFFQYSLNNAKLMKLIYYDTVMYKLYNK